MSNNYKLTEDTFTVTSKVGYKGDFKADQVIQSFTQWQDWDAPWKNVLAENDPAKFMNVVCNVFEDDSVTQNYIELTCGEEVLQELWVDPGYKNIRGKYTGYPVVDGDVNAAPEGTCPH